MILHASILSVLDMPAAEPAERQILDAARQCAEDIGLDNMTVEDIARLSGISRTTIYRRMGGREAILRAMIADQARPYAAQSIALALGPGDLAERLEAVLVEALASVSCHAWITAKPPAALGRESLSLFSDVSDQMNGGAIGIMLQAAAREGRLRSGLDPESVFTWLLRQIFSYGIELAGDRAAISDHVRRFILPVLLPDVLPSTALAVSDARLDRIEGLLRNLVEKS